MAQNPAFTPTHGGLITVTSLTTTTHGIMGPLHAIKHKALWTFSFVFAVLILVLIFFRRDLETKMLQKRFVLYYHTRDMEELKQKIADLEDCKYQLIDVQLDLSWYIKRVEELEAQLSSLSKRGPLPFTNNQPILFLITPTYARWTQKADLTRLCQTLMHVPNLIWIVIEDSNTKTSLVTNLLSRCTVNTTHLNIRTSPNMLEEPYNHTNKKPHVKKPRGVEQRNIALQWLRSRYRVGQIKGVVYFADDDNTYDLRVFDEMRNTDKVSVWPVGIAGGLKFEGPICSGNGVKTWHAYWAKDRMFQIDFAGFAVNLELILNSKALILTTSKPGYIENDFLEQLIDMDDLEPKANGCRMVLVWHTRTEKPSMFYENQLVKMGHPSNPNMEVR